MAAGEVVGCYTESLVSSDLTGQKHTKRSYGDDVMTATVGVFSKWAFSILDTIVAGRGVKETSWIALAPFHSMLYISDARYFSGNRAVDMLKRPHPTHNSVRFAEKLCPENRSDIKLFSTIAVEAVKNVDWIEELGTSSGSDYRFPNIRNNIESQ